MDEQAFMNTQLVQDAVIRNFEVIGEASNNIEKLYPEFAAAHPELPLAFAYQMRNVLQANAVAELPEDVTPHLYAAPWCPGLQAGQEWQI